MGQKQAMDGHSGSGDAQDEITLIEDVGRHADEAERVLVEITRRITELVARDRALVVP